VVVHVVEPVHAGVDDEGLVVLAVLEVEALVPRGSSEIDCATESALPGSVSRWSGAWSFGSRPKITARPISVEGQRPERGRLGEEGLASSEKSFPAPLCLSSQRSFSSRW
jgi:hypothetical protein